MMAIEGKLRTVGRIGAFYAARPSRIGELKRFVAASRSNPLDRREPWWPFTAIAGVRASLPPQAHVFEFGGGGSTLWLTDQGAHVTVAEHEPEWVEVLRTRLPPSATVLTAAPAATGTILSSDFTDRYFDDYVALVDDVAEESLDLVIIDGRARVDCGLRAMPKVKPSGLLLLDDSDRPRYSRLREALTDWERTDYRGVKVNGGGIAQTSTWRRSIG